MEIKMKGFIALTTTLTIFAIILLVGISISLLSITEAKMGLQKVQSSQAYYLANLCAEWALIELRDTNGSYTGEETILGEDLGLSGGSCEIFLIERITSDWIVKVIAEFSNQTKKMKIVVDKVRPRIEIDSWQEVAEF